VYTIIAAGLISRYILVVQELVKQTPENDPDKRELSEALEAMQVCFTNAIMLFKCWFVSCHVHKKV